MSNYNVHSHIFTMENAPSDFLKLYLPAPAASAVNIWTNTTAGVKSLSWILKHLGMASARYATFLTIGKNASQLDVFETLMKQYTTGGSKMKFVALSLYMEECGAGKSNSGFMGQLTQLAKVKQRYPKSLLAFVGLDPRWQPPAGGSIANAITDLFNTKIEAAGEMIYPFCGLKIYPSTGFYPFDDRLIDTYKWAAENDIPVMAHCNYLGGIYNNDRGTIAASLNPYISYLGMSYGDYCKTVPGYIQKKSLGKWLVGQQAARNNKYTCSYFLEPAAYIPLLDYLRKEGKTLKICLAHYGGREQIWATMHPDKVEDVQLKPFGVSPINWYTQIKNLLLEYKNVYTDISFALYDPTIYPVFFEDLNNPAIGSQILFGTDFFLTETESPEAKMVQAFMQAAKATPLPAFRNISAWEKISEVNPKAFLGSRHFYAI